MASQLPKRNLKAYTPISDSEDNFSVISQDVSFDDTDYDETYDPRKDSKSMTYDSDSEKQEDPPSESASTSDEQHPMPQSSKLSRGLTKKNQALAQVSPAESESAARTNPSTQKKATKRKSKDGNANAQSESKSGGGAGALKRKSQTTGNKAVLEVPSSSDAEPHQSSKSQPNKRGRSKGKAKVVQVDSSSASDSDTNSKTGEENADLNDSDDKPKASKKAKANSGKAKPLKSRPKVQKPAPEQDDEEEDDDDDDTTDNWNDRQAIILYARAAPDHDILHPPKGNDYHRKTHPRKNEVMTRLLSETTSGDMGHNRKSHSLWKKLSQFPNDTNNRYLKPLKEKLARGEHIPNHKKLNRQQVAALKYRGFEVDERLIRTYPDSEKAEAKVKAILAKYDEKEPPAFAIAKAKQAEAQKKEDAMPAAKKRAKVGAETREANKRAAKEEAYKKVEQQMIEKTAKAKAAAAAQIKGSRSKPKKELLKVKITGKSASLVPVDEPSSPSAAADDQLVTEAADNLMDLENADDQGMYSKPETPSKGVDRSLIHADSPIVPAIYPPPGYGDTEVEEGEAPYWKFDLAPESEKLKLKKKKASKKTVEPDQQESVQEISITDSQPLPSTSKDPEIVEVQQTQKPEKVTKPSKHSSPMVRVRPNMRPVPTPTRIVLDSSTDDYSRLNDMQERLRRSAVPHTTCKCDQVLEEIAQIKESQKELLDRTELLQTGLNRMLSFLPGESPIPSTSAPILTGATGDSASASVVQETTQADHSNGQMKQARPPKLNPTTGLMETCSSGSDELAGDEQESHGSVMLLPPPNPSLENAHTGDMDSQENEEVNPPTTKSSETHIEVQRAVDNGLSSQQSSQQATSSAVTNAEEATEISYIQVDESVETQPQVPSKSGHDDCTQLTHSSPTETETHIEVSEQSHSQQAQDNGLSSQSGHDDCTQHDTSTHQETEQPVVKSQETHIQDVSKSAHDDSAGKTEEQGLKSVDETVEGHNEHLAKAGHSESGEEVQDQGDKSQQSVGETLETHSSQPAQSGHADSTNKGHKSIMQVVTALQTHKDSLSKSVNVESSSDMALSSNADQKQLDQALPHHVSDAHMSNLALGDQGKSASHSSKGKKLGIPKVKSSLRPIRSQPYVLPQSCAVEARQGQQARSDNFNADFVMHSDTIDTPEKLAFARQLFVTMIDKMGYVMPPSQQIPALSLPSQASTSSAQEDVPIDMSVGAEDVAGSSSAVVDADNGGGGCGSEEVMDMTLGNLPTESQENEEVNPPTTKSKRGRPRKQHRPVKSYSTRSSTKEK